MPTLKTDEEIKEAYERIEELLNLTKGKDDVFINGLLLSVKIMMVKKWEILD